MIQELVIAIQDLLGYLAVHALRVEPAGHY